MGVGGGIFFWFCLCHSPPLIGKPSFSKKTKGCEKNIDNSGVGGGLADFIKPFFLLLKIGHFFALTSFCFF